MLGTSLRAGWAVIEFPGPAGGNWRSSLPGVVVRMTKRPGNVAAVATTLLDIGLLDLACAQRLQRQRWAA